MPKFNDAQEAYDDLNSSYNAWGEILTNRSIEASYAIIAANWAVHGGVNEIINNGCAKWSMIVVFVFLGLNLLGTRIMVGKLYNRAEYAEKDTKRWEDEHQACRSNPKYFPYTKFIDRFGVEMRGLKTSFPILAAGLFIWSLF